jgi:Insertion element 4 transposase N-terminal/Transposase DDE domain
MARSVAGLPSGTRLTDFISIGVLARAVPLAQIHVVLERTGRRSLRQRDLPAHVTVYYVIALALYMHASSREVLRCLLEGLRWLLGPEARLKVAGKSGISQARARLGPEPLRALHDALVRPVAVSRTKGAWYRGWRLASLDGSTLDVADTAENEAAFGRPGASRGGSAFPQIRFISLVENGTHVLFGTRMDGYGTSETTLATQVLVALRPGMLCLADRQFLGHALWRQAQATGADLLWRAKANACLDCEQALPDGSYLSRIYAGTSDRRNQRNGLLVRAIDYRLEDVEGAEPIYRLVTTILDPGQAPADDLAALYHERWEVETALDELKTHLRGRQVVLRSKTPDLVRQEFWGLLLAHFAVRGLMHEAALRADEDPDRLSFVHAVRVVRRQLPRYAALPPSAEGDLA